MLGCFREVQPIKRRLATILVADVVGDSSMSLSLSETDTGSVVWNDRLSQPFDELAERLD